MGAVRCVTAVHGSPNRDRRGGGESCASGFALAYAAPLRARKHQHDQDRDDQEGPDNLATKARIGPPYSAAARAAKITARGKNTDAKRNSPWIKGPMETATANHGHRPAAVVVALLKGPTGSACQPRPTTQTNAGQGDGERKHGRQSRRRGGLLGCRRARNDSRPMPE